MKSGSAVSFFLFFLIIINFCGRNIYIEKKCLKIKYVYFLKFLKLKNGSIIAVILYYYDDGNIKYKNA